MPLDVHGPDVVADITALFEREEAALVSNDVDRLDELFWDSPEFVPDGRPAGLPVGLQLVAPPGREHLLVTVGKVAEAALA